MEAGQLHTCVSLVVGIGHRKMRKDTLQGEIGQGQDFTNKCQYLSHLLCPDAQPSHTCINLDMYLNLLVQSLRCPRQGLRGLYSVESYRQPQTNSLAHLPGRNITKDENGRGDPCFT